MPNPSPEERLGQAWQVLKGADLDETGGDHLERVDTLRFIISGGTEGRDWGHPREHTHRFVNGFCVEPWCPAPDPPSGSRDA